MVKKQNWKNLAQKVEKPVISSDSEIDLDEEDLSFLQEFGQHSQFLLNFERNLKQKTVPVERLPIKDSKGRLKSSTVVEESIDLNEIKEVEVFEKKKIQRENRSDGSQGSCEDDGESLCDNGDARKTIPKVIPQKRKTDKSDGAKVENAKKSKICQEPQNIAKNPELTGLGTNNDVKTPKKQTICEIKELIASNANLILEDPQKHFKLIKTFDIYLSDSRASVKKLGLMSLLQIYMDILPLYKIRKLTPLELEQKLSRDVLLIREYENSLVKLYQSYLQTIERILKSAKSRDDIDLTTTCLYCISQLLLTKPHFNYKLNLLTVLISNLTLKHDSPLKLCCNTVIEIFKTDLVGESTRDCVKLMSDLIHKHQVSPPVLDTFLHLNLSEPSSITKLPTKKHKDSVGHITKRQKKVSKHLLEAQTELASAEASYDKSQSTALQSETLKYLFLTYFRILKNPTNLTSAALEGLAKFAYLINVDFFSDILTLLKGFIKRGGREAVQCVSAAFGILDKVAVESDLREFYVGLYGELIRLAARPGVCEVDKGEVGMVVGALESMIRKREVLKD